MAPERVRRAAVALAGLLGLSWLSQGWAASTPGDLESEQSDQAVQGETADKSATSAQVDLAKGAQETREQADEPQPQSKSVAPPADPCAEIEARLNRRRQWLQKRRIEQFARGGAPDANLGIPDVTWQWCVANPDDIDCNMPKVTVFFSTEELRGGQAPEEYDPHVVLMRRELNTCRRRPWR